MAGHSKWANIRHRKGAQDAKKGKLFTRIIREISISAKIGGPHLNSNPRLRKAVHDAKSSNMPNQNIERAIKKERVYCLVCNMKKLFMKDMDRVELLFY